MIKIMMATCSFIRFSRTRAKIDLKKSPADAGRWAPFSAFPVLALWKSGARVYQIFPVDIASPETPPFGALWSRLLKVLLHAPDCTESSATFRVLHQTYGIDPQPTREYSRETH
jgi:hypothetical protein